MMLLCVQQKNGDGASADSVKLREKKLAIKQLVATITTLESSLGKIREARANQTHETPRPTEETSARARSLLDNVLGWLGAAKK